MKNLITILLLFAATILQAQPSIGLSIYQDAKLAVTTDDHGNTPFTPDLKFKLKLEGYPTKTGNTIAILVFEYADLYGGEFYRYGSEIGYRFNTIAENITVTPTIGYGMIGRSYQGFLPSWEFSTEATYKITNNLTFNTLATYMQRSDLPNNKLGFNFYIGFGYEISTDYLKKQAEKGTRF